MLHYFYVTLTCVSVLQTQGERVTLDSMRRCDYRRHPAAVLSAHKPGKGGYGVVGWGKKRKEETQTKSVDFTCKRKQQLHTHGYTRVLPPAGSCDIAVEQSF